METVDTQVHLFLCVLMLNWHASSVERTDTAVEG